MCVLLSALLVGACGVVPPVQTDVRNDNTPSPTAFVPPVKKEPFLGVGDQVEIYVWGYSDFSRRATVDFNGTLSYAPLGQMVVSGKSLPQVEEQIRDGLSGFIKAPVVRVSVAVARPQRINVMGEVKNPGVFALTLPSASLAEAVAMAGGMTTDARGYDVIVIQRTEKQIFVHTVDFREITHGGNFSGNLALTDGDIVYVPAAYMADIAREARRLSDIFSAILGLEGATILMEPFIKALTHSPTRPGTTSIVTTTQ
jgi:polysaccharide export outer membrane protein